MARLTIPDEQTYATFTATAQTVFPISFALLTGKPDLRVKVDGVELSQSDFTFSGTVLDGGGYYGGTVTLNTAATGDVVIWRDVTPERASQFAPANVVPVGSVDLALNRLTASLQDLQRDVGRALLADFGTPIPSPQDVIDAAAAIAGRMTTNGANAGSMVGLDFDAPFSLRVIGPDHAPPPSGIYQGSGGINLSLETFISSPSGAADSDNQRAQLALIATTTDGGNSEEQNLLVMTKIVTGYLPEFIPNHLYAQNDEFRASGSNNVYKVILGGMSGATPPTGKGSNILNGAMRVTWINDAAINAKCGGYFETVVGPGAGAAWGIANNVEIDLGCLSPFTVGFEFDLTNNSGVDSEFGGLNRHNLYIYTNGTNRSTSSIEVGSLNTANYAAFWGMHFVGNKLAENAVIAIDASSAFGIGFGLGSGGVGSPVFTQAVIGDSSTALKGLSLDGDYAEAGAQVTGDAPAAFVAGGTNFRSIAGFYDISNADCGFRTGGDYQSADALLNGEAGYGLIISNTKLFGGIREASTSNVGLSFAGIYAQAQIAGTGFIVKPDGLTDAKGFKTAFNPPATVSSPGQLGQLAWDAAGYQYVCIATNTWRRSNLYTTW